MNQSITRQSEMISVAAFLILHVPHSASSLFFFRLSRPGPATLSSFYRVRPVVETGWEVMLINRALQEGEYSADTILKEYTVRPPSLPPFLLAFLRHILKGLLSRSPVSSKCN